MMVLVMQSPTYKKLGGGMGKRASQNEKVRALNSSLTSQELMNYINRKITKL